MGGWGYATFTLWTVSITGGGALLNQRAANISGNLNPLQVNQWWLYGIVSFQVGPLNGPTFSGVRIYGSHSASGFPPAGTPAEAIAVTAAVGGPNQGLFRSFRTRTILAGGAGAEPTFPLVGLPPFLLLEYDVAAGGAGTSVLTITATLYGPEMSAHE